MADIEFPALYKATDTLAISSQSQFLQARGGEFIALVLGAGLGEVPGNCWDGAGPLSALILIAIALFLRVSGIADSAERRWYDARAAAESIKSSSWQYAVCGEAFRLGDTEADSRLQETLRSLLSSLKHVALPATKAASGAATETMRALRAKSLKDRQSAYRVSRVNDQAAWYEKKAQWHNKRAKWWKVAIVCVESLALLLGLFRALGWYDVDWLGVFAGLAAGLAAWQQVKQFTTLSEAYSVTSHELSILQSTFDEGSCEELWAMFVHDAEAAFSREHTMWSSRRQGAPVSGQLS